MMKVLVMLGEGGFTAIEVYKDGIIWLQDPLQLIKDPITVIPGPLVTGIIVFVAEPTVLVTSE
jgi:hypothetical protein